MNENELFTVLSNCSKPCTKLLMSDCERAVLDNLQITELNEENKRRLRNCFDRYKHLKSKYGKKGITTINSYASSEVIIDAHSNPTPQSHKKRKLESLKRTQLHRRTDAIFEEIKTFAKNENYEEYMILGLLLMRCRNKKIQEIGESIWSGTFEKKVEVPVENSLVLYTDCNLGRKTYTNERKVLSSLGFNILPPWSKLRQTQREVSPEIMNLKSPHVGVYFPLFKAVQITTERIFLDIDESKLSSDNKMKIKFGFDGSGSHAIYHQVNNVESNNMILSVFCPLRIINEKDETSWTQKSPNAPLSQRPVCLQMGKESVDALKSLEIFNDNTIKGGRIYDYQKFPGI